MPANYKAELVGVFGFPVAENPTGVMQEAAFAAAGLNWRYLTIEVPPEGLANAFTGLRAMGFQGINLTIPHKVAVIPLLDDVAPDARLIGAVNTVRREGSRLIGENTDGKGFLRGLREVADPAGMRVVLLGAGGAARAIAVELALAGAQEITIVNRSAERGLALADHLRTAVGAKAHFVHWTETYPLDGAIDVLVNATSIGLYPDVDAQPDVNLDTARDDLIVCDVIPNPPETPLIRQARGRGMRVINGLAMLVYQGSIGFAMWTGRQPDETVMKDALQKAFEG
jgi:shikimate dehydrogenase